MNQSAIIKALYRYPLKGFSAEPLESAALKSGETLPFDRAFAIENGPSGFDPAAPSYLPKIRFLMLMRHERVARYTSRFDPQTGVLTLGRPDRNPGQAQVAASLDDDAGRSKIEDWIAAEFPDELRGPPRIVSAPRHSFSDKKQKVLHLINLASVRMLEEKVGRTIDPMRFRANIVIDGVAPFTEFDWIGKRLQLPGLTLAGEDRTERCAATNVEPETGIRDINLPRSLMGLFGHTDFGIYVKAQSSGTISIGDAIAPA